MLEARAAENDAKAQAARAALQTAYAQSDALAAAIARGETVSEAQLAAVQAALAEAEKQSQIASTAADQAQQDRDQIEQLRQQQAQDNASGGTQSGAQITPSRTALEDAALAVDRYTASVAQAEEAAMAGASAPQFVQNNYSPEALSASEIYRQTKNLTSAAEIKMGVPTG
jgi:colicin import membrane protein